MFPLCKRRFRRTILRDADAFKSILFSIIMAVWLFKFTIYFSFACYSKCNTNICPEEYASVYDNISKTSNSIKSIWEKSNKNMTASITSIVGNTKQSQNCTPRQTVLQDLYDLRARNTEIYYEYAVPTMVILWFISFLICFEKILTGFLFMYIPAMFAARYGEKGQIIEGLRIVTYFCEFNMTAQDCEMFGINKDQLIPRYERQ